jgi:hypothetical protein
MRSIGGIRARPLDGLIARRYYGAMPDQSMNTTPTTETITVDIPAGVISDVITHIQDAAAKVQGNSIRYRDEAAEESDPEIRDALRADAAHALERFEQLREVAWNMKLARDQYRQDLRDRYPAGF